MTVRVCVCVYSVCVFVGSGAGLHFQGRPQPIDQSTQQESSPRELEE